MNNKNFLYRIDNWINKGSGWLVELIKSQYSNISTYRPLSGSSYVKFPTELRSSKNGIINIKNKDHKCFLWCHVRPINPVKIHPERFTKEVKNVLKSFIMMLIFLCKKKIIAGLKENTTFALKCFVTKIG